MYVFRFAPILFLFTFPDQVFFSLLLWICPLPHFALSSRINGNSCTTFHIPHYIFSPSDLKTVITVSSNGSQHFGISPDEASACLSFFFLTVNILFCIQNSLMSCPTVVCCAYWYFFLRTVCRQKLLPWINLWNFSHRIWLLTLPFFLFDCSSSQLAITIVAHALLPFYSYCHVFAEAGVLHSNRLHL